MLTAKMGWKNKEKNRRVRFHKNVLGLSIFIKVIRYSCRWYSSLDILPSIVNDSITQSKCFQFPDAESVHMTCSVCDHLFHNGKLQR